MPNFCIRFFNTRLSSDGHPFKVLQRVVNVRGSKTSEDATEAACRNFEQLENVPDWRLHADSCECEAVNEKASSGGGVTP